MPYSNCFIYFLFITLEIKLFPPNMKVNPIPCILFFRKPQIGVIISKSPRAQGFGGMLSSFLCFYTS